MRRHPICTCSVAVTLGVALGLAAWPAGPAAADEGLHVVHERVPRAETLIPATAEIAGAAPVRSYQAADVAVAPERARLAGVRKEVAAARALVDGAAREAERARLRLAEADRRYRESAAEAERARERVDRLAAAAFRPGPLAFLDPRRRVGGSSDVVDRRSYRDLVGAQRAQAGALAGVAEAREALRDWAARLRKADAQRDEGIRRYREAEADERRVEDQLADHEAAREQRAASSRGEPRSKPAPLLAMPVEGRKSSDYGQRLNPYSNKWRLHAGVDIAAPGGTPIRAAAGGTVTRAGWSGGYGNYTCLGHGDGLTTCYAHQSRILVEPGQRVRQGEVIGRVGTTGASTGNHLHFEVRRDGTPTDPAEYLPSLR